MKNQKYISRACPMDYGVLAGLILLILMFEVIPESHIGRLATRTVADEMQGFDPGELYEMPPEVPEENQIDIEEIIRSEIPEIVLPELVISTSMDTAGLEHVTTVDINYMAPDENPLSNNIPDPGTFIPHSVPPVCTFRPVPDYPDMARQAGVEGRVILQVFITAEGKPAQVVITQSSGLGSMDRAAEESVRESSWSPAKRDDGVAVGVWTSVVYNFVLE